MTGKIDGETCRFIVIQSDRKDKRKLKTLDRAVKREHTVLAKDLEELKKRPSACKRDAEIEVKKFIKEHDAEYHI